MKLEYLSGLPKKPRLRRQSLEGIDTEQKLQLLEAFRRADVSDLALKTGTFASSGAISTSYEVQGIAYTGYIFSSNGIVRQSASWKDSGRKVSVIQLRNELYARLKANPNPDIKPESKTKARFGVGDKVKVSVNDIELLTTVIVVDEKDGLWRYKVKTTKGKVVAQWFGDSELQKALIVKKIDDKAKRLKLAKATAIAQKQRIRILNFA